MADVSVEARRILNNMASMAGYHGTTTAQVVDYFHDNWSMTVFCGGQLRNVVFTPTASPKHFNFKTEASWKP